MLLKDVNCKVPNSLIMVILDTAGFFCFVFYSYISDLLRGINDTYSSQAKEKVSYAIKPNIFYTFSLCQSQAIPLTADLHERFW